MTKAHPVSDLQMIPLELIDILNPRDRNARVFEDIVGNIQDIGLKKPGLLDLSYISASYANFYKN